MTTKLDKLLSIRKRIIGDLDHHIAEAKKFTADSAPQLVAFRNVALEKSYKEFVEIGEELEKINSYHELENVEELITKNRSMQDKYLEIKMQLLPLIQNENAAGLNASFFDTTHRSFMEANDRQSTPTQSRGLGIKLPHITITPFDGKFEEWLDFEETFTSIMKKYTGDNVEKFIHLKTFLRGEALSTVKHLGNKNESYEAAWELLKNAYDNKNAIIEAHLATVMNLPTIVPQFPSTLTEARNTTNSCLSALKSYNIMTETWDPMIVFILKQKLGPELRGKWEEERKGSHESASLKEFLRFLDTWHKILANTAHNYFTKTQEMKQKTVKSFVNTSIDSMPQTASIAAASPGTINASENEISKAIDSNPSTNDIQTDDDDVDAHIFHSRPEICGVCGMSHRVFMCPKLANNSQEALQLITQKQLCTNCLYKHDVNDCKSKGSCKVCSQRHHTLLHNALNTSHMLHVIKTYHNQSDTMRALLATALVPVTSYDGGKVLLRALVDQGSTSNLISERGAQLIRCDRQKTIGIPMIGLGNIRTGTSQFKTTFIIGSMYETEFALPMAAYITPFITTIRPITREAILQWQHLKDLELADPSHTECQNIDLLIGSITFAQILQEGLVRGDTNEPIAQKTRLGWLTSGANSSEHIHTNIMLSEDAEEHCFLMTPDELPNQLKQFWEIEETPKIKEWSDDEKECDSYFTQTIARDNNGRFIMRIPFKIDPNTPNFLGDSLENAKRRFFQLERRFARNPQLKAEYSKGIHEYLKLGHAIKIPIEQACHVIPHHAVFKESSTTTKLRTVYNASAKTTNGYSLNDRMHIGPTILTDLWAVLIRWRKGKVAMTADIEKMYRQFWIHKDETKFLQILWRDNPNDPLELIELLTVTFGTAGAPYMAIKALHIIADTVATKQPKVAKSIKKSFYVDDFAESRDNTQQAKHQKQQITDVLSDYGLNLRQWNSNVSELGEAQTIDIKNHTATTCSTLGMQWDTGNDQIGYKVSFKAKPKVTKRTILSDIASLFDPLGLLAPIIMQAKVFMQQLWLAKATWDDELSIDLKEEWQKIKDNLIRCSKIRIPRWIGHKEKNQHVSLHGFCDASEQMYAAACYLRTAHENGTIEIHLITAKTRVAPLKSVTIPRLELCAAVLLANLLYATHKELDIPGMDTCAWTDSSIVLAWISTPPYKLKTFVSSRVRQIQEKIPAEKWRHVKTNENPADYATRTGIDLLVLNRWWNGPSFLLDPPEKWPRIPEHMISSKHTPEMKIQTLTLHTEEQDNPLLERYTSLDRLLRITAICLRSKKIYRTLRNGPGISTAEITNAKRVWIRHEQMKYYSTEINLIQQGRALPMKSSILSLNPMLDEYGLLRVQGRLKHALLPFSSKHPIILPASSTYTKLSIRQAHFRAMHGGLQLTLRTIRDEYWIVKGKQAVKTQLGKCITCYRDKCKPAQQQMADLLAPQVQPNLPFAHTGVDFAGYFEVKTSNRRNAGTDKCYVSLFICLTTKAVHLELVPDLTTEAFIEALRCFVARRGIPTRMYSDRGTNFIGAAKELPNLWYDTNSRESKLIQDECTRKGIDWHFNPGRASHFGGLWEAGVKSMKTHLHRILKDQKLLFKSFNALIIQIEACLNSRPLCPISDDPDDFEVLTPGHFIMLRAPLTLPHPDMREITMNRLSRYQLTQQLFQSFWDQWSHEYLTRLQKRPKWKQQHKNLNVGQIVVIKEDNLPPTKWILGRIIETFKGTDGSVRSARLICKGDPPVRKGEKGKAPIVISRPIHKLCLLPIEDNMNDDERMIYEQSLIRGEDVDESK